MRKRAVLLIILYLVALLAGFALTRVGTSTWDSGWHRDYMVWLAGKWQGLSRPVPFDTIKWYGPLWEYVLLLFTSLFGFLRDPMWVRHAATFSLLPATLAATWALLRASGETRGTALVAVALLLGNVRFVGHSLLNVKDFPFACGYLLVTLGLWRLLRAKMAAPVRLLERPGWLFVATAIAVVPYLLRAPVVQHWLLLVLLCLWTALFESALLEVKRKWAVATLPLLAGPLLAWLSWPTLWETGISGFLESFGLFSRFAWVGQVRAFGRALTAVDLPWWYAPSWILVSWEPVSLLLLAAGLAAFAVAVVKTLAQVRSWSVAPLLESLRLWVLVFALAPWAAVLVLRPVLYDEERHLLFAMPLLAVAAALGLSRLPERLQLLAALLVLASSGSAFASWGKYSYVYKDPLLPHSRNEDFLGDYWSVSTGAMAQALYDHVPSGATVVLIAPEEPLKLELLRRRESLLNAAPAPKSFELVGDGERPGGFYVLATNRNGLDRRVLEDIDAGRAVGIWRETMPPGNVPAAVLASYSSPCPYCRVKGSLFP